MASSTSKTARGKRSSSKSSAGPIAFFVSLFIVAIGAIQLVSTFQTYALNLSQLNALKRQEASLVQKKQDLENEIKRWDDKAYVTAQARERLGFVFPGEQAIQVEHPEAVTGQSDDESSKNTQSGETRTSLPWYSELSYAFQQADKPDAASEGSEATNTHDTASKKDAATDQRAADGAHQ